MSLRKQAGSAWLVLALVLLACAPVQAQDLAMIEQVCVTATAVAEGYGDAAGLLGLEGAVKAFDMYIQALKGNLPSMRQAIADAKKRENQAKAELDRERYDEQIAIKASSLATQEKLLNDVEEWLKKQEGLPWWYYPKMPQDRIDAQKQLKIQIFADVTRLRNEKADLERKKADAEASYSAWKKRREEAEQGYKKTSDFVLKGETAVVAARDCIKDAWKKRQAATTTTTLPRPTTTTTTTSTTTTTLRPTTTTTTTTTMLRPTTTTTTTTTMLRPTTTTTTTTTLRRPTTTSTTTTTLPRTTTTTTTLPRPTTTTTTTTTTLPPPPPPPGARLTVSVLDEATRREVPNMRVDLTPLVGWKTFLRGPDRMVFEGLPPDSYSVTAEAEGYTSGSDRVTVTQQSEFYSVVIWLKKKEEKKAPTPRLTARLDCGGLLELVPGQGSKTCTVIVEGWRSNTADPVEVTIFPNPPPGGIVISGNTSVDPGNMYPAGVSDKRDEYPIRQSFLADDSAPPGTTTFQVVRQRGAGTVTLPLTVIVLPKTGGPVGPAPGGAPGGPGVPAPTASATGGQLRARLQCGGVLEVVPGQGSTDCDVILEGWSRSSSERVEVELVYPKQTSGIEVTPGNTSAPPENMYPNSNNEYLFGEGFSARPNAPAGTTPIMVRVRQRGAGEVMLSLNVTVLPKTGGPFGAVPAPAGGLGGLGLPAPTPAGTSGQLSAELDCGGSFELAPGLFDGRNCGIIVRGWRSSTTERVEVEVVYPRESSGIEVSPGSTSQDPGNMHSTSASDYHDRYVFSQTFKAKDNAPPGVTPIRITVRQRGTGQVTLTLNVAVLEKGLLPSTGPGIRPPVTGGTGSGGEYCVWRYKPFGRPPECFGFDEAPCTSPRHNNPRNGYELERPNMTAYEAVALATKLSSFYDDKYGCRSKAAEPTTTTTTTLPPTTTTTTSTTTTTLPPPPPPRVLSRFGVFCEPKTIVVGESASCTARGEYSDEHKNLILTGVAAWDGGPTIRGERPGSFRVTASLEGASDTATVTVIEKDDSGKPSDGKGEGTDFDPTNVKHDPNQPGTDGPFDTPVTVTPGGPTDGQPAGGEKTPKDGKPGGRPPAPVVPYRPPTTTNTTLPPRRPPPIAYRCRNRSTGAWEPSATACEPIVRGPKRPPTTTTTLPRPKTPTTTLPPAKTPTTTLPPAKTPGSGGQTNYDDLSGTWYYSDVTSRIRQTMTLSRVAAGKWQGPLDRIFLGKPSYTSQVTLQLVSGGFGGGKLRLTWNSPSGFVQLDGGYTGSQMTFNIETWTRNRPW
jgi:hypothetical protein